MTMHLVVANEAGELFWAVWLLWGWLEGLTACQVVADATKSESDAEYMFCFQSQPKLPWKFTSTHSLGSYYIIDAIHSQTNISRYIYLHSLLYISDIPITAKDIELILWDIWDWNSSGLVI
ncbi:hypothetical protein BDV26DRAFT_81487 [Aspergillus bertholletiae]|uniref:Uncharacterized protein n=1 Tax=Aspergillus bertholletiae TaxID=1226010 RepID=A0A5N7ASP9_9EURO|nr:hypothetical protein BDV26DRAFT_81487 [Aspergillus bertholletiae]